MKSKYEMSLGTSQKRGWLGLVYGSGGAGKTTWASLAPNPVFIQTKERGLTKIKQYTLPPTKDFDDFMGQLEFCDELIKSGRRDTIVIDTSSSVNSMIGNKVMKAAGKNSFADMGFNTGWEKALCLWQKVMVRCQEINDDGGNVLFVGHGNISKHKTPQGDDYGRVLPDLYHREGVSSRDLMINTCDFVFYMKTEMLSTTKGKGVMSKQVAASDSIEPDRKLFTDERSGYVAKTRYDVESGYVLELGQGAEIFDLLRNS